MTTRRCRRCGDTFTPHSVDQDRCLRCAEDVAAIVAADTRRRVRRFDRARDMSGVAA